MEKLAFTIKEASEAVGLGRTTIYELIKAKQLTPIKIGERTLLHRRDLEDLLERRRIAA